MKELFYYLANEIYQDDKLKGNDNKNGAKLEFKNKKKNNKKCIIF